MIRNRSRPRPSSRLDASVRSALDRTGRISLYDRLVADIPVRAEQVDLAVRPTALRELSAPAPEAARQTTEDDDAPLLHHLIVPARQPRVGMEMRLLFEVPHRGPAPKPDPEAPDTNGHRG